MIIKDSKAFKIVLQNLQKFADKSSHLDILNYVKFYTTEGSSILTVEFSNFIHFSNSRLQFYYQQLIELDQSATFTTVFFLHLSELKRLVAEMVNASKIQIEAEGLVLSGSVLKFVNSKRFTINEFPNFKQPELEWLPAPEDFQQVLTNAEKFVDAKEDREFLGGTWWYVQDGKFFLMGVDGHIAYFHTFPDPERVNFEPFCVPLIAKFLNPVSTIGISKTHLQLIGQNFILTTQLPQVQAKKLWEWQFNTPEYFILTPEILAKLPKKTVTFCLEQLPNGMTEFRETFEPASVAWKFEAEIVCTCKNYVFVINWGELQVITKLLGDFRELQLNFNPLTRLGKTMINAPTPLIINDGQRKFYSMAVKTYSDQDE
jgi:hypothetical protein